MKPPTYMIVLLALWVVVTVVLLVVLSPGRKKPARSGHDGVPARFFGKCKRCGESWKYAESHDTYYSEGVGIFVLCEPCWKSLTPEQRLPYYRQPFDQPNTAWASNAWQAVQKAVLEGK